MASPGRSLQSHSSWSAVASRRSPSPDQFSQSNIDISSPAHKNSAEQHETVSRYKNRALTVNTTLGEAFGPSAQAQGEGQDPEEAVTSPLHQGGPMEDIARQSHSGFSSSEADFSAKLRSIPVDLRYSMDRFFAPEMPSPEEECEALRMLDENAQKTERDLKAMRRYINEMEEDEALRQIGSIHAQ